MMKIIYVIIFLHSLLVFSQIRAKVVSIKDGDTVVALLDNNTQETLRLAEVDCPENRQPFGKNAKQFTSSKVFGKNIIFYRISKDRYRRTVAKIFYDKDKYLSAKIIKSGFGWWYYKASKNFKLKDDEILARSKKLGLWSDKDAVAPWDFRKRKKVSN